MHYYGVSKTEKSNELKHWKYIKKVRVNGKWRYFYDDSETQKYDNNVTENSQITTKYKNTDRFGDSESVTTYGSNNKTIVKNRGKLSRSIDNGKNWINKKIYGYSYKDKYDNNITENSRITTKYENSNKLFDSESTTTSGSNEKTIVKRRGKLSQYRANGEKWIYEHLKNN